MKIIGTNGQEITIDIRQNKHPVRSEAACKSKLQYRCGQILREKFPHDPILDELPIPGHGIFLDFFLPTYKIVIEIDGRQHDEYVPFFHKNKRGFTKSKDRDAMKEQLCDINGFVFCRVDSELRLKELLGIKD